MQQVNGRDKYLLGYYNPMTNINDIIGKQMTMEVSENVALLVEVISETKIKYQFIGLDDGTKDPVMVSNLEIAYDSIEDVNDYCFITFLGSKYFLHQFQEVI